MVAATKGNSLDSESRAILYEGANLSQLGILFRMDHRVLVQKLHGVEPTSKRGSAAIYEIATVAPYLVKPMYDIEQYIKKMHHNDLPRHLTKEFWAGQRSRQEYELKAKELWPTTEVVKKYSEVIQLVKMQLRLTSDAVERQTDLSSRQKAIIREIMDNTARDLMKSLEDSFPEEDDDGEL